MADCENMDPLLAIRPMTERQRLEAEEDLVLIARGEEAEGLHLPWRRLRRLLDHGFVKISYPVVAIGSNRSLDLTDKGLEWLGLEPQSHIASLRAKDIEQEAEAISEFENLRPKY